MAKSLAKIEKQIAELQRQADAIRQSEVHGVVERIKVAIAHYQLTPQQLFGAKGRSAALGSVKRGESSAKYADGNGNVWSGRGPRPIWLRDALQSGAQLQSFLDLPASDRAVPSGGESKRKTKARVKRAPSKVLYADGTGKTWTGRGPRPSWVKEHLEAGKDLSELLQK